MAQLDDFTQMTRLELRKYILNHRDNQIALSVYLDRFASPSEPIHPAPQSIDDLSNYGELHQQYLERKRREQSSN